MCAAGYSIASPAQALHPSAHAERHITYPPVIRARRETTPLAPDASPPPRAPRYLTYQGREILRGAGFLRQLRLTCPGNHRVAANAKITEGLLFCDHREHDRDASCGWSIYTCAFPGRGGKARIFAADCTREEHAQIERLQLDPDGILEYFGLSFRRGAA